MKKIILALVVILFTTPAWASVAISVTDIGDGKGRCGHYRCDQRFRCWR
ncbi:MAG: hypothetical protein ACYSTT_13040 [Planctomycetota bacterium]|jgi:hypothetical protein